MLLFLDTEFTQLHHPELLSLALVSEHGHELYVELDLQTGEGRRRLERCSYFVREEGVLGQWGRVSGAAASLNGMARRTHQWLHERGASAGGDLTVLFDYSVDHGLLCDLLERLPKSFGPVSFRAQNVGGMTSTPEADLAAQAAWRDLAALRGLQRHHALADAHALRQAFSVVRSRYSRPG